MAYAVEDIDLITPSPLSAIMQLRKVCNHPFVFEEIENTLNPNHATDQMIIRVSGKFELLDRMLGKLKATGHRV